MFDLAIGGILKLLELHLLTKDVAQSQADVESAERLSDVHIDLMTRHLVAIGHSDFGFATTHASSDTYDALADGVVEQGACPAFLP